MRIVITPDRFKGTYTAEQVATAIATGVHKALAENRSAFLAAVRED